MEPYVISVSRREDVPAFRTNWLLDRLKDGHVDMEGFYQDYQISFKKTKLAVFWTKNPRPLMQHLHEIPFQYYFQYTLNYYPEYELNVPQIADRIKTFIELSNIIGKEKVIWRFDPIIVDDNIKENDLLNRIKVIGDKLYPYTEKLVFSYIDPYDKLKGKFKEIPDDVKIRIAKKLLDFNKVWKLKLATCAEAIDLEGIEHNKCVDPELIERIVGKQRWLKGKDKAQRTECGCIASGDIGSFRTCRHKCQYCYAS
jgi:hypothetical protein